MKRAILVIMVCLMCWFGNKCNAGSLSIWTGTTTLNGSLVEIRGFVNEETGSFNLRFDGGRLRGNLQLCEATNPSFVGTGLLVQGETKNRLVVIGEVGNDSLTGKFIVTTLCLYLDFTLTWDKTIQK